MSAEPIRLAAKPRLKNLTITIRWRSKSIRGLTSPLNRHRCNVALMPTTINRAFVRLKLRADRMDTEALVKTFVNVGDLFALLSSTDNHVIYGRRGTGKTHALAYLKESATSNGDVAVLIDMRTIGSAGGLYADSSLPIAERGTRLLVDTLAAVQDRLVDIALGANGADGLPRTLPMLDRLADAVTEVRVEGTVEREALYEEGESSTSDVGLGAGVSGSGPSLDVSLRSGTSEQRRREGRLKEVGVAKHTVHFGAVHRIFEDLLEAMEGSRLWVLLDEWSDVPIELQPLLADFLRRCFFPIHAVTVKIGAIEQRSTFRTEDERGNSVGIELGADASAPLDLDDFMVFGMDLDKASSFFSELIYRHVDLVFAAGEVEGHPPGSAEDMVQKAFTRLDAFRDFVRAAEGVPRDALHIASYCAQLAEDDLISMQTVRKAARRWYIREKEGAVRANRDAHDLLNWIVDRVIGDKRARAFLLRQGEDDHPLIRSLYDSRVLHVVRRGIAARDQPGVRFDAFALDYGCYVELLATQRAPKGLMQVETEGGEEYIDVPADDYRSIRQAILTLDDFEKAHDQGRFELEPKRIIAPE